MKFHKEGIPSLIIVLLFTLIVNGAIHFFLNDFMIVKIIGYVVTGLLTLIIVQFFRSPTRNWTPRDGDIISPADGTVVVIEEVEETEFFNEKRLQVSVFMSPLNVHNQLYPISGEVEYTKYHLGKYLVAWHPKSSLKNERTTVEVKNDKISDLFRQIAGEVTRSIVTYAYVGDVAMSSDE